MDGSLLYLTTAFALIFVIEGLLYAIFPSHIQKMMEMASQLPEKNFRSLGVLMLTTGVFIVWILQKL